MTPPVTSGPTDRGQTSPAGTAHPLQAARLRVAARLLRLTAIVAAVTVTVIRAPAAWSQEVVAQVGDESILDTDLDAVLRRIDTMFPGSAPDGIDASTAIAPAGTERQLRLRATALEQLIDERLLRAEIRRAGILIDTVAIDTGIAELRQRLAERGLEWEAFLARSGYDEQSIRSQVALEKGLERLIAPRIDEAQLRRAFEAQRREFDGTRLRVSHIVLRPEIGRGSVAVDEALERATMIRRSILAGERTFEDAARDDSNGPSRRRGGDLGWISRTGPMIEDFSRRAFALAKGDISEAFASPFGIHIVRVTDVEPGRLDLDAARPQLVALVSRAALKELVARLRATVEVTYAPGVPHFEPAAGDAAPGSRRLIVEGAGAATPGPAGP